MRRAPRAAAFLASLRRIGSYAGCASKHMHQPTLPPFLALPLLWIGACSAPAASAGHGAARLAQAATRPLPALEQAIWVWDSRARQPLELSVLLDRLAAADVVFVGETHLDDTTHRVEAAVLEGLLARRAGKVVLSLEMFERDVQPVLDDYLAGRIDERAFLASARPWGNYRSDYRPLIETAKRHGIPVVAANAPASVRRRVSAGGQAALDALAPAERRLLPAEILPAEAAYWERVDRATRGHMGFSSQSEEQRLYSGQNLWDNSMGNACAEALAAHPGSTVVHVVGGFHVMYRDGTVAQLVRRARAARVAVLEVLTTSGAYAARPARDAARADYVVYADELARSLSNGTHAVSVPAELRYTIDLPSSASDERRVPLLVCLPDGDERPQDVRALLRAALGDETALVVLEPPFSERADDLAPGGRWFRAGEFRADQTRVQRGLERIVEYVTRRFPVDAERVVIAGRGLGATSVLWSALYTEWLSARFVAITPRAARALQLEGLPDQAPATRALRILVAPGEEQGSRWIAADYQALGTPAELTELAAGVSLLRQVEPVLRAALELDARAPEDVRPELFVLERDLPRARQWAEVLAWRSQGKGRSARVLTADELRGEDALRGDTAPARIHHLRIGAEWPLATFAEGQGLPLASGDFGGTTVLVVPAGAEASERAAWLELERAKALKKRSPFHGLRVALQDGRPDLGQVLDELRAGNTRSVLVVPAVFCASPEEMRALRDSIDERRYGDAFDLEWLPGLGAELCCASPED